MNFALFVLATIGMTHIIVDSSIFSPVRSLLEKILPSYVYKVFECYQCSGTWCGFFIGWTLLVYPFDFDLVTKIGIVFSCGCAGSFLSTLAATFLNYLEARSIVDLGEEEE
jgi:hypothetical protein